MATINGALIGSYVTIAALCGLSQVVYVPFVLHLLLIVAAILFAACHQSLVLLSQGSENDADQAPVEKEIMRQSDAYQFPLIGSLSLFSLYLAFRYLDKDIVNLIIGTYFGAVGCVAVMMTLEPAVSSLSSGLVKTRFEVTLPILSTQKFSLGRIISFLISVCICTVYFAFGKKWYMNNVIGICFCLQGIERFSLGTYKTGAILLSGLFFYDIFWVFGTEVMVSVAKSLDGPIKLLFPRNGLEVSEETGKLELSLLGLGDIVVPGFFLALLLRFDAHRAGISTSKINIHEGFSKPYFISGLFAYICGLGLTLFVMFYFGAAQPALLYLVPACIGSSLLCATLRGELGELLAYSEEEEEEEDASLKKKQS